MLTNVFVARQSQNFFQLSILLCAATVCAQSNDPGGSTTVPAGDVGSNNDPNSSNAAGNSGSDSGAMYLSKGATIAIAVVVGIVVVLGITTAVLFYLTKKKQWNMRASFINSAKRVGSAIKNVASPRTPHKMTFSPIEKRGGASDPFNKRSKSSFTTSESTKINTELNRKRDRDLEKGTTETSVVESETTKDKKSKRSAPPAVTIPQSSFEMESPKTPMWSKVFGR